MEHIKKKTSCKGVSNEIIINKVLSGSNLCLHQEKVPLNHTSEQTGKLPKEGHSSVMFKLAGLGWRLHKRVEVGFLTYILQ